MKRLVDLATRLAVHLERIKPLVTAVGWVGFALISADYAGFIDLPVLIQIPLWLGFLTNIARWALWEGMIRPKLEASSDKAAPSPDPLPRREDER